MTAPAIEVRGLRKRYGRITALDGIDLTIAPGEFFGLLGPNGAGKTTAVKIILGLTAPTEGAAMISGLPVFDPESRRRVGYLPEGHKIPGYLTARQTLSIFGRMSGMDSETIRRRSVELLEKLRIAQWIDVRVKKFSKGMTQRLGLARALVIGPEILFLDEPTASVDQENTDIIESTITAMKKEGNTTVIMTTHDRDQAERLADRMLVMNKGRIEEVMKR